MSPADPGPGICLCGHFDDDHDFLVCSAPCEECQCQEYEWRENGWWRAGPTRRDIERPQA